MPLDGWTEVEVVSKPLEALRRCSRRETVSKELVKNQFHVVRHYAPPLSPASSGWSTRRASQVEAWLADAGPGDRSQPSPLPSWRPCRRRLHDHLIMRALDSEPETWPLPTPFQRRTAAGRWERHPRSNVKKSVLPERPLPRLVGALASWAGCRCHPHRGLYPPSSPGSTGSQSL